MEEEAKRIMSSYCAGDYKAVEEAFKQMDENLVKHAVERARNLGNSAFSKGAYRQAVQHYSEALAGEQPSRKHYLLSNRSACYLLLREYEQALEDARMCIRLEPKYAKGWYRAARVLFETGKFSGAEAAFKASRKHETDECKQKELDEWTERAGKHAYKAKLIDRVTVDYSRFDNIEDPDTDTGLACAESDPSADGCNIEFSESLSKEQRRQLELFLTGKVEKASATGGSLRRVAYKPSTVYSEIPCYADVLEREGPRVAAKCQKHSKDKDRHAAEYRAKVALEAPVALCKFLQLTTEVKEPKKLADSLEEAILPAFLSALETFIEKVLRDELRGRSPEDISWLFLGCGTCVPLVTAARLLERDILSSTPPSERKSADVRRSSTESTTYMGEQRVAGNCPPIRERESRPEQNREEEKPSNLKPITACTVFLSTPLKNVVKRMLESNKVDHLVNLVQQTVDNIDCAGESADELDRATKDMTKRAQVLVIDPSLLDEALIGRQIIHYVRRARAELCVTQPTVFPSSATVFVQAFSIHLPRQATGYDWGAVETAARWSPYAEAISVKPLSEKHSASQETSEWQHGDVVTALSRPQAAFTFCFDGPLNELDRDVPLEKQNELVFECTTPGILNALVAWYQLRGPPSSFAANKAEDQYKTNGDDRGSLIIDCGPALTGDADKTVTSSDVTTALPEAGGPLTHTTKPCPCKQAVFWIDPISVEKDQILTLQASHTATRLRFRIVSPCESPARSRHLAIPRYHLDLLRDPHLIGLYQQAIARVAAAYLKKNRLRTKKYEQFGNQAPSSDLPAPPCLSMLCVGGAPAPLPALAGHAVATEIVKAAGCAASSWQQKQANLQTFHITVADSWPGSVKTCRKVFQDNAHLLLPHCLAPEFPIPKEEKWKPIAELTGRVESNNSAPLAAKDSSDCDPERNGCNVVPKSLGVIQQKPGVSDPLLKAKLKKCFSCIQKDVRQVKPPAGDEDTTSLLTLAELYRLPPGSDVKTHLEQAEAADPTEAAACRLQALASICVCGLFDNGCLGEGVLPLSKFIARVLLVRDRATFVPRRVRALAVLLELGKRTIGEVNVEAWRTYRYLPDYTSIDLDEETVRLLSDPFLAWDFDLDPSTLSNTSSRMFVTEQKDIKISVTQDGEINAVAFWFELDIDEVLTISTSPACVACPSEGCRRASGAADVTASLQPTPQGNSNPPSDRCIQEVAHARTSEVPEGCDRRCVHRTKAWKQAVQMLPPLKVTGGSTVVVGAAHDSTKMLFRVDPADAGGATEICRPLYDSSWTHLLEKQQALSAGWMKALCGAEDAQNATHAEQATEAALCIAADAGRQRQFRIDPQEAASFALTLFY